MREIVRQLQEGKGKLENLSQRVAELEEKQSKNSKNSSQPPSKDGFGSAKGQSGKGRTRRRNPSKFTVIKGKQERGLYEPEACRAIHDIKASMCRRCGERLSGVDARPQRHQVVDVPEVKPDVVEYRLHELECEHCGTKTRGQLPEGVSGRCYGVRVAGWVGLMSGEYRQSHRQVQGILREGFGIELSRGSINRIRQEVSEAVEQAVEQAQVYVQQQPVVHCDETGFAQGNQDGQNPEHKRGWLWVLLSPLVSVFVVALSRSQATAKQMLGAAFGGVLVSDRASCYPWVDPSQRQVCWAHLLRDFQAMAERPGVSQEIGEALLRRGYRLFHWWHRVRDGTLSPDLFVQAMAQLRQGLLSELQSAANLPISPKEKTPLAKTVRTCRQILNLEPALWTFVETPGVEPTNNAAERALRPAVIWRYTSFGSQSQAGSQFVARLLTVNTSLKAQGRSVLEFLIQSCQAARLGIPGPSLLPLPHPLPTPDTAQTLIAL
jgi:transposase